MGSKYGYKDRCLYADYDTHILLYNNYQALTLPIFKEYGYSH